MKIMKILGIVLGGLVSVIFVALLLLGAASEHGFLPSTETLPADDIPKDYLTKLRQSNIIHDDEEVYFFYSAGLWSILEDGNLFTDERVISYEIYEDQLEIYTATYNEIEAIEFEKIEGFGGISEIKIIKKDGSWFILFADNEHDRDTLFLNELNKIWLDKNSKKAVQLPHGLPPSHPARVGPYNTDQNAIVVIN